MLIFPPSIKEGDADRPVIVFRNLLKATETDMHIVFPIPQSFQFGDSATYNNTELGFGGSVMLNAARENNVSGALDSVKNQAMAAMPKSLGALGHLASAKFGGNVAAAGSIATQTTFNKNIVTEFSGVATRAFSFVFKLITTSVQESNLAKKIVDEFRLGLYPEGNSLQLRYPPTWYINFQKGGKEIEYIPKIFETYLTALSTTYNSSMNLFHPDGSPVEIDINLSFMESRALTRGDIKVLIDRPFKDGDFTVVHGMSTKAYDEAKDAEETALVQARADESGVKLPGTSNT